MSRPQIPRDPTDPAYDLIPESLAKTIPRLYASEKVKDPMVHVKFFTPDSSWTWLVTGFDPDERRCFCLVIGLETELGYFSLDELEEVRGPMGLPIERDLSFKPKPLSECRKA